jgi:hypothetical protein
MRFWWKKRPYIARDMTPIHMADVIEGFVDATLYYWGWDDFMSIRLDDPDLEKIRQRCIDVDREFPPTGGDGYCNKEGVAWLLEAARTLRTPNSIPTRSTMSPSLTQPGDELTYVVNSARSPRPWSISVGCSRRTNYATPSRSKTLLFNAAA